MQVYCSGLENHLIGPQVMPKCELQFVVARAREPS